MEILEWKHKAVEILKLSKWAQQQNGGDRRNHQ
jgi:hypothetical protein